VRVDRRALIAKEFKLFARDLSHTIQLAMLLAICFIYLYNFQTLEGPTSMAEEVRVLWQLLLLLVNAALSFLVVTCICSRFVFPSVSMEGTSFWILQSAPVSMRNILRAKVAGWFLPVASISAVIFMSGAMAIGADEPLVLASCAAGVILAYGLVGLGVGLGALFAHFEWEYASQVSTNVGSFLFMGLSVLFLVVSLVPIALSFGAYALAPNILPFSDSPTLILVGGLVVLAIINYACAATALSVGSRSLKAR
jgi:ABC-2 type transport system permease protein